MLLVRWGVWQSRQVVDQEPYLASLMAWLECGLRTWQSTQSWFELSRTSRLPSPVPGLLTAMTTAAELTLPPALAACARSVYVPGMRLHPDAHAVSFTS